MYNLNESIEETRHIAIIMDGNGRWAVARGLERLRGHARGVERVRQVIDASPEMGVTHLTLFAFSTENWKRTAREVSGLMSLFRRYIKSEADRLHAENVRVRFIGIRDPLEKRLRCMMGELEERTSGNTRLNLTIALNYGGRDELVRATRRIGAKVATGELQADAVTEEVFEEHLDTAGLPDPDLVIRTSGEYRTSNFLPWQSAYSEYVFIEKEWPDFTPTDFAETLGVFDLRDRRFGAVTAV